MSTHISTGLPIRFRLFPTRSAPAQGGLILVLCAALFSTWVQAASAEIPYRVSFEGIDDRKLKSALKAISQAVALQSRPPVSEFQLQRRVDQDLLFFQDELHRQGYYNGTVTSELRPGSKRTDVRFLLDPGPVYRLRDIRVTWADADEIDTWPAAPVTRLQAGKPGHADMILQEEARLVRRVESMGFPFATVHERDVVLDKDREILDVHWELAPGPKMYFGPLTVEGLRDVKPSSIQRQIPWREGDLYNVELVHELENSLLNWGVFSTVRLSLNPDPNQTELTRIGIQLNERKHRTVRLGANYRSDVGPGGLVSWEHRNLFGRGDSCEFKVEGSAIAYSVDTLFRKNNFRVRNQSLEIELRAVREDTDAYQTKSGETRALLKRKLDPALDAYLGVGYKYTDVDQAGLSEIFQLVYIPTQLDWNTSDSILDPSHGIRLIVEASPYHDVAGNSVSWLATLADMRGYWRLTRSPRIILAGRLTLGSLMGSESSDIPADERLYAGGGGSVRGYGYQSIGPLADDDTPLGGSFLAESSIELRADLYQPIGVVLFLDSGYVGDDWGPDSSEKVRQGLGAGLRYATPIGPIRADVAIPLDPREEFDDPVQFYISLGHSF